MKLAAYLMFAMGSVLTTSASAGIVTWDFTAQITAIRDGIDLLDGSISGSTPVTGSFSFDTSAVDLNTSDEQGKYNFETGPELGMLLKVGNYTVTSLGAYQILTTTDTPPNFFGDSFRITATGASNVQITNGVESFTPNGVFAPENPSDGTLTFYLADDDGEFPLTDGVLPVNPPSLEILDSRSFEVEYYDVALEPDGSRSLINRISIGGFLTSLERRAEVPVPMTGTLLLAGMLGMIMVRKKQSAGPSVKMPK